MVKKNPYYHSVRTPGHWQSCRLCVALWLLYRFSFICFGDGIDPMDYNLPASSVHGISQARILEWVAIFFSRGSSQPRNRTYISCLAGGFFTTEPSGKPQSKEETGNKREQLVYLVKWKYAGIPSDHLIEL